MPDGEFDDDTYRDKGQNSLIKKFEERFSVRDDYFSVYVAEWVELIENDLLRKSLKTLSKEQIDLLTEYYVLEKSRSEIAKEMGLSYTAVANRLARIRKLI